MAAAAVAQDDDDVSPPLFLCIFNTCSSDTRKRAGETPTMPVINILVISVGIDENWRRRMTRMKREASGRRRRGCDEAKDGEYG